MAFNFPDLPTIGTVFVAPDGVTKYYWNGTVWMLGISTSGSSTTLSQEKK